MINPEKIDEWIREAEERSSSAPLIIRMIANRLRDLTDLNEELLAENLALRSGKRVEEYESRIANLEYQVNLLKRQLGGEIHIPDIDVIQETKCVLIYSTQGQVLRVDLNAEQQISTGTIASFIEDRALAEMLPRLLVTSSQEELLFVFDSGRTITLPVSSIPITPHVASVKDASPGAALDWQQAFVQEPRGSEELVAILPIAKMSLFDFCVQTSRKGYLKKLKESFFETCVANTYVGTGVNLPSDKTCSLTLCEKDAQFVMVSKEGFLLSIAVNQLTSTIEEAFRLGPIDHIVAAFVIDQKPSLLIVTQNGKTIHRDTSWLDSASSFKTKGQPIYSKERRDAGVRVVGAASVDEMDWGVALRSDGKLTTHKMSDLFGSGSILTGQSPVTVLGFTTFRI